MATNPKLPNQGESRRGPVLVPKAEPPRSAAPGVALAIVTAALLLAAILYFMPRAPKRDAASTAPAGTQAPVAGQAAQSAIQISDLRMTPSPTGGSLNLNGQLNNSSSETLNGVMTEVSFTLNNGQTAVVNAPVSVVNTSRRDQNTNRSVGDTNDPVRTPIAAGEQRPIRITVNEVPKDWNHSMPTVRVLTTTGQ